MLNTGEVHVWRVRLDRGKTPAAGSAEEAARAERLVTPALRQRYLRAHGALREILAQVTDAPLAFGTREHGKPHLVSSPEVRFNLSHSREMALVAVTRDADVGVDIERIRPLAEYAAIARRYFPAGYTEPRNVREFFGNWTRFEAMLKAHGSGLYGAGSTPEGEWTVTELAIGPRFAAALVVAGQARPVVMHDYQGGE
jgi:4'-phosphopantetheinyl transferase